ncbi:hypothetical protein BH24ACT9_BH24ACT9_15810 [soil metagenome]
MTTTASVLLRPRYAPSTAPRRGNRSTFVSPIAAAPQPALLGAAAAALSGAFLTMIYLHAISVGELSPMSTTVSDLIFVDGMGWLFAVSTGLLALASLAVPRALARTGLPGGRLITDVLGLWCLGLIVAAVFPTDPIGDPLTLVGEIHRYAGATMYVSLPVAGWLVHLGSRTVASWDSYRGAVRTLSLASAGFGVLFLLSSAPSLFPGTPMADLFGDQLIHGLVERVLILSLFGLLLAIGVGAGRAGRAGRAGSGGRGLPA